MVQLSLNEDLKFTLQNRIKIQNQNHFYETRSNRYILWQTIETRHKALIFKYLTFRMKKLGLHVVESRRTLVPSLTQTWRVLECEQIWPNFATVATFIIRNS